MELIKEYLRRRNLFNRENVNTSITLHMLGAFGFALLVYPYIQTYATIIAILSISLWIVGHFVGVLSKGK